MSLKAHGDRLAKLFRLMMSASSPGEIANARDAIMKIVAAERQDVHDLANVLVNGLDPKGAVIWKPPSLDEPARDIAAWCLFQYESESAAPQNERELEFLQDMTKRWGPPSEKQTKWLASIHNRILRQMQDFPHAV